MHFSTQVDTDSKGFLLRLNQHVMMMGSCFTESIGSHLKENRWSVCVNPFGVLYNPLSIFRSLGLLLQVVDSPGLITEDELCRSGEVYYHWNFSSEYASTAPLEALHKMNSALQAAAGQLRRLDVLFLTFGTNRYYRLAGTDRIVANCHKQPQRLFVEQQASVADIVEAWKPLADRLFALRPSLRVVLTVSPYRYLKYGLHQSRIGKAVLLLAAEGMMAADPSRGDRYRYFPAYEILNDELRDYRFYAPDMVHPSPQATDYVWERFCRDWLSDRAARFVAEWRSVIQGQNHRPVFPQSAEYRAFAAQLEERRQSLLKKYGIDAADGRFHADKEPM